jgi:NTP pyrophosphatase (non-canonical NTP hydrolase)
MKLDDAIETAKNYHWRIENDILIFLQELKRRRESDKSRFKIVMEPCHKYTSNTPLQQAIHITEEAYEVIDAILNLDEQAADMEVMDVIQSCITYFAIRGYSQGAVDKLAAEMHKKNSSNGRDYYRKVGD